MRFAFCKSDETLEAAADKLDALINGAPAREDES